MNYTQRIFNKHKYTLKLVQYIYTKIMTVQDNWMKD